jgi:hypothetical protein
VEQLNTPFSWGVIAVIALAVAAAMIIYAVRKKDEKAPSSFGEVDGILKQDWATTGKIDFHVTALKSTSPQPLILRVEEMKIVENSVGEDVVQLRWRLATLEEAKELVVCWNTHGARNRPS